jgi:hypothetical protein
VERGEDHVTRERRLQRDLGGLAVAHLADHDDVRILPQNVAERLGEPEADLRLHGDLVERVDHDLDGVFDRHDVDVGRRYRPERGVERRRLAAAGRPGHQDEAVRAREKLLGELELRRRTCRARAPRAAARSGRRCE